MDTRIKGLQYSTKKEIQAKKQILESKRYTACFPAVQKETHIWKGKYNSKLGGLDTPGCDRIPPVGQSLGKEGEMPEQPQ